MYGGTPGRANDMRIAFISDVHGNEVALRGCLDAIKRLRIDRVRFIGDAVGYMPGEIPVLDLLGAEGIECQQGNHEAMMLAPRVQDESRDGVYRLSPARKRLAGSAQLERIRKWPTRVVEAYGGKRFLLVHGSPTDELFGYVHGDTDLRPFSSTDADVIVVANTHRPWIREYGGKLFVNTGSIGLPRDHGALAAFAIFDSNAMHCHIARVPIDVREIARRYGGEIAPEVAQCFARRVQQPFGEIIR